jgi:hypothetical protein
MGLFGLSILFVNKDFSTYVFCFVGSPSIDMAKSIYFLRRERRWWGFVTTTTT